MFTRPLVPCASCGAKVYWGFNSPQEFDDDTVLARGTELPAAREKCPRCAADLDTTIAYAFVPGFPPRFERLKAAYAGFLPEFVSDDLERGLSGGDAWEWYRQALFYRSCTAFYRSLQLFLGFLVLQRRCFITWATITGYYCRFFFIQALINLTLSTWDSVNRSFFFFDGTRVQQLAKKQLSSTIRNAGSHEVWWQLMEAMKNPFDYPINHRGYVLSRLRFDPEQRNNANYSFEYLQGGFIELDRFHSGAEQMVRHFMPSPTRDWDITEIDRVGEVDGAYYYGDYSHLLWCSLKVYLEMLRLLDFRQHFILTENIAALAEIHLGNDYPELMRGILLSAEESLRSGFDVDSFLLQRENSPNRISSFWPAL